MKIEFNDTELMRSFISEQIGDIDDATFDGYLDIMMCDISLDLSLDNNIKKESYSCYHALPLGNLDYAFSTIVTPLQTKDGLMLLANIDTEENIYICADWN